MMLKRKCIVLIALVLLGHLNVSLAAPQRSHLGVKASEFVNLRGTGICPGFPSFFGLTDRILPDGSMRAFTIPLGKVLVITDFGWATDSADPGSFIRMELLVINPATSTGTVLLTTKTELVDNFGLAASVEHLTAGLVISRDAAPCANPQVTSGNPDPGFDVHVYGYLIDDR
jgi:hypothetical protein